MSNYPIWSQNSHPVDHLLFDIGYSYGLLRQSQEVCERVCEALPDTAIGCQARELCEALREFRAGRLQATGEIYDNIDLAYKKMLEREIYTCPVCGQTSHNPNDVAARYCGACHVFEADYLSKQQRKKK